MSVLSISLWATTPLTPRRVGKYANSDRRRHTLDTSFVALSVTFDLEPRRLSVLFRLTSDGEIVKLFVSASALGATAEDAARG